MKLPAMASSFPFNNHNLGEAMLGMFESSEMPSSRASSKQRHHVIRSSALGSRRRWPLRMDFCAHIALSMRSIATADRNLHVNAHTQSAKFEGLMEWRSVYVEIDFQASAEELAEQAQEAASAKSASWTKLATI